MQKKRNLAIGIAVLALVAAELGALAVHRFHDRGLRRLAGQLSGNARTLARSALADKLKMIDITAMSAGQLPQIRGQIATFDAATLKDGFRSEAWWAPFRNDFSVYGVANETEKLDVIEGMEPIELDAAPLIRDARAHRQASGLIAVMS